MITEHLNHLELEMVCLTCYISGIKSTRMQNLFIERIVCIASSYWKTTNNRR